MVKLLHWSIKKKHLKALYTTPQTLIRIYINN